MGEHWALAGDSAATLGMGLTPFTGVDNEAEKGTKLAEGEVSDRQGAGAH